MKRFTLDLDRLHTWDDSDGLLSGWDPTWVVTAPEAWWELMEAAVNDAIVVAPEGMAVTFVLHAVEEGELGTYAWQLDVEGLPHVLSPWKDSRDLYRGQSGRPGVVAYLTEAVETANALLDTLDDVLVAGPLTYVSEETEATMTIGCAFAQRGNCSPDPAVVALRAQWAGGNVDKDPSWKPVCAGHDQQWDVDSDTGQARPAQYRLPRVPVLPAPPAQD